MRDISALTILAVVASSFVTASGARAADNSSICRQLNLSSTAEDDCEQQMATTLTDTDRVKVIHIFATGLANARADTLIGQLSSPALAATSAPAAAPPAPAVDTDSQKPPADQPPSKAKGLKTSLPPPDKPAKKGGQ